jgi:hypothetical protein
MDILDSIQKSMGNDWADQLSYYLGEDKNSAKAAFKDDIQ